MIHPFHFTHPDRSSHGPSVNVSKVVRYRVLNTTFSTRRRTSDDASGLLHQPHTRASRTLVPRCVYGEQHVWFSRRPEADIKFGTSRESKRVVELLTLIFSASVSLSSCTKGFLCAPKPRLFDDFMAGVGTGSVATQESSSALRVSFKEAVALGVDGERLP